MHPRLISQRCRFAAGRLAVWLALVTVATADEVLPPAPTRFFNDYAGVVSAATASSLEQTLEQFERDASGQIVVAVFPKMQSDAPIEDYTLRVARSWRVGQAEKNSGAVLFVFVQDRKMYLQVGYGYEGALPDALCKRIIEDDIKPRFRQNDFDGGLRAGVNAILAATKGEYRGSGQLVSERLNRLPPGVFIAVGTVLVVSIILLNLLLRALRTAAKIRSRRAKPWKAQRGWWRTWVDVGRSQGAGLFSAMATGVPLAVFVVMMWPRRMEWLPFICIAILILVCMVLSFLVQALRTVGVVYSSRRYSRHHWSDWKDAWGDVAVASGSSSSSGGGGSSGGSDSGGGFSGGGGDFGGGGAGGSW